MNFISANFHLHYLASYSLLIQQDDITNYLIVLSEEKEVLVFLSYNTLNPSEDAVKMLSYPFTKVVVALPHQQVLWVPRSVFDVSEKNLYSSYFLDSSIDGIFHKEFDGLEAVALYQFDSIAVNQWKVMFPTVEFVPLFSVFIDQCHRYLPSGEDVLCVLRYDNKIDIMVALNGVFKFYNTFEVETLDDLNFYILSLIRNLSITSRFQKLLLSGVEQDSEWIKSLTGYADELVFLKSESVWTAKGSGVEESLDLVNLLMDSQLCV